MGDVNENPVVAATALADALHKLLIDIEFHPFELGQVEHRVIKQHPVVITTSGVPQKPSLIQTATSAVTGAINRVRRKQGTEEQKETNPAMLVPPPTEMGVFDLFLPQYPLGDSERDVRRAFSTPSIRVSDRAYASLVSVLFGYHQQIRQHLVQFLRLWQLLQEKHGDQMAQWLQAITSAEYDAMKQRFPDEPARLAIDSPGYKSAFAASNEMAQSILEHPSPHDEAIRRSKVNAALKARTEAMLAKDRRWDMQPVPAPPPTALESIVQSLIAESLQQRVSPPAVVYEHEVRETSMKPDEIQAELKVQQEKTASELEQAKRDWDQTLTPVLRVIDEVKDKHKQIVEQNLQSIQTQGKHLARQYQEYQRQIREGPAPVRPIPIRPDLETYTPPMPISQHPDAPAPLKPEAEERLTFPQTVVKAAGVMSSYLTPSAPALYTSTTQSTEAPKPN